MSLKKTLTPLHSFSLLKISGEKAHAFLQGQLTCDMRNLSLHGSYSFAACCDHKGRMLSNFWVVNWHNEFLLILPNSLSEILKNHLQKYAVLSKIIISRVENFFIGTLMLPRELLKNDLSQAVYIQLLSKNRFLIIAEKNIFSDVKINADEADWKKNNIADQLCILYPETSLLFTPQMIGLEKYGGVSFTKGCYVGQEIVARTQHLGTLKRHLHRLQLSSDCLLKPGDDLKNEKNEVMGVIVEAVEVSKNNYDILAVVQDHWVCHLLK